MALPLIAFVTECQLLLGREKTLNAECVSFTRLILNYNYAEGLS